MVDNDSVRMVYEMASYCKANNITLALFASKPMDVGCQNMAVLNGDGLNLVKTIARAMDEKTEIAIVLTSAVEAHNLPIKN